MPDDWSDKTACRLLNQGLIQKGICLLLGAADTGKTALATAIARHTASSRPVAIIDADVGQSHIGPPTTVGWAVVDNPPADLSQLTAAGISFVGDVTPAGHLLQLTAAITQCVRQASEAADLIIIDTPGLVRGPSFKPGSVIKDINKIIISGDMVATDAYCAQILDDNDDGFDRQTIAPTLSYAEKLGLGTADLSRVKIIEITV